MKGLELTTAIFVIFVIEPARTVAVEQGLGVIERRQSTVT